MRFAGWLALVALCAPLAVAAGAAAVPPRAAAGAPPVAGTPSAPSTPPAPSEAQLERGRALFNARCYFCHGYAGDAATTAAAYLQPRPRDFTRLEPGALDRAAMRTSIRDGRGGTAMPAFGALLSDTDIDALIDYVATEFVERRARRVRYHLASAGWAHAFPAKGDATAGEPAQRDAVCLTCHAAPRGAGWTDAPALDLVSAASPYAVHDRTPTLPPGDVLAKQGEGIFQENCAFCHARDGSGRNWIGSFLEPHARDLRTQQVCNARTLQRLPRTIAEGLPGTSMPAWGGVLDGARIAAVARYVRAAFCGTTR